MQTKLEKAAPLAEIISSVAIVATLIYLAIQTNQTNSALEATSRQATLMADMTMISALVSNPEVGGNLQKSLYELTDAEAVQLGNTFAALMRSREFAWLQFQNEILDEATFESYLETLLRWISDYEVCRYYWDMWSELTNPAFARYVNDRLSSAR